MHSVQEELSGHLYFKVKCTLTTLLVNNCRFKWRLWCRHHSAADSLGPVWGVHIWHDNSGSSPSWYLKQVEVCEVSCGCLWTCCFLLLRFLIDGHLIGVQVSTGPVNKWLFVAQCWLAVDKDDGWVERTLRVCEQGITFAEVLQCTVHLRLRVLLCNFQSKFNSLQLLRLKLHDYLADYHIWMSVLSCPHPNPFTHTQRLCVSLVLLLGYAAVNIAVILQMEDQVGQSRLPMLDPECVTKHFYLLHSLMWPWLMCPLFPLRSGW